MNKKITKKEKITRSVIKEHIEDANSLLILGVGLYLLFYFLVFFLSKFSFNLFSICIQIIISTLLYVGIVIARPPIPIDFSIGDHIHGRWLEPEELSEVERKMLTFILSDAKRTAIKATILVCGIFAVCKFVGNFLKRSTEDRNLIEDTILLFLYLLYLSGYFPMHFL